MYSDPSGNFAISALIIGAIVGAVIGFAIAAQVDYKDDGEVFNGSVKWYDYLGATVAGGVIGAGLGAGASALAGASFSFSIPTFGLLNTGGSLAFGVTGATTLTVTGTQILQGVGALGSLYLFSYNGNWPGDNPAKGPDGFEWKGRGRPGSPQGNWYNPKTGEILHPDLNHPDPIGPHWDFRDILKQWWRIFKNGKFPK